MRSRPHPVRYILLERRKKLAELARETGLPYERLRRAVNGESRPTRDLAERVSLAVGLPTEALFRLEDLREDAEAAA